MNAQFKQSVVIDGHRFIINQNGQPKVFSVPSVVAKHPHFKKYMKAGLIVDTDQPATPQSAETPEERSMRLHAKIAAQHGQPQVQRVESDPVVAAPEEAATETDDEEAYDSFEDEVDDDASAHGDSDDDQDFGDEDEIDETPKPKKKAPDKKKKKKVSRR